MSAAREAARGGFGNAYGVSSSLLFEPSETYALLWRISSHLADGIYTPVQREILAEAVAGLRDTLADVERPCSATLLNVELASRLIDDLRA